MMPRSQRAPKQPWSSGARIIAVALGVALGLAVGAFYLPRAEGAQRNQVNAALNAFVSLACAAQIAGLLRMGRVRWAAFIAAIALANVALIGPSIVILAYAGCALYAATFALWAAQQPRLAAWSVWLSGIVAAASKLLVIWR